MGVELSSPDKVLWPDDGITKQDLHDYLVAAADRMLPHLGQRPLSVKRYPRGIGAKGFFQKNLPDHAPDSIERFRQWAETADREVAYAVVDSADDLAWFAQQNTIEFHPALVRVDRPGRVDRLVIDIDPGPNEVPVGAIARWVRELMQEVGLEPLVTTSGGRGMHVIVPIERRYDPTEIRSTALGLARLVVDRHPDELTIEFRKDERGGRTLLDWSRTSPGATLAVPWGPRARPGGTVATPLEWDEVDADLDPSTFTMATALDRDDPWPDDPDLQRLEHAREAMEDLGMDLVDISPRGGTTADKLSRIDAERPRTSGSWS